MKYPLFSPEQDKKMSEMYRDGYTPRVIASVMHIEDHEQVRRRLYYLGVRVPKDRNNHYSGFKGPLVKIVKRQKVNWDFSDENVETRL